MGLTDCCWWSWQSEATAILLVQRYAGESLAKLPASWCWDPARWAIVVSSPCCAASKNAGLKQRWTSSAVRSPPILNRLPLDRLALQLGFPEHSAGLDLLQTLDERQSQCGPVDLAINLDGFNPVTQVVASWLRPQFIAGGVLTNDLRRTLPWGDLPQQRFLEEPDWDSPAFLERHSSWLSTNSISELFCRWPGSTPTCMPLL